MEIKRKAVEQKAATLVLAQILIQKNSSLFTDEEALLAPHAFEEWGKDRAYTENQIVLYEDNIYRVIKDIKKSTKTNAPNKNNELYYLIANENVGTVDNPIPLKYGMLCRGGNYYDYENDTYKCGMDILPCVKMPTEDSSNWEKAE